MSNARDDAYLQRRFGETANGTVELRDFDVGVMNTLVGPYTQINVTDGSKGVPVGVYVAGIPGLCPPDGYPGVPIIFAYPDDSVKTDVYPSIIVRRDDISPAKERWEPSGLQYRGPGEGALRVSVTLPNGQVLQGYDRSELRAQAEPFDIMYTISAKARFRGTTQRNNANALFKHLLKTFPPYGQIVVTDSLGDLRGYDAFNESITNIDEATDIQNRVLGYAITLRVEAELDLEEPETYRTVTGSTGANLNLTPLAPRVNRF